ncbi:MAG: hypothetical protein IJP80_03350 [Bacteroidales bacterium]|nr:hypothetical protein [Bacteroidales bacterium]
MKRLLIILLPLVLFACSREKDKIPLYSLYSVRTDLTVAQVEGFQLNDSVKVDVVILVADDSAAWQGLKEEFDILTSEGVTSWRGDLDNPRQRVKRGTYPMWRVMAVHDERTVAFYRVESQAQFDALRIYQMDKLENKNH